MSRLGLVALVVCLLLGALGGVLAAIVTSTSRTGSRASLFIHAPARARPPDFRLNDQDGDPMTLGDVRGDVVVMTFIYTTCRDLCPAEAAR